MKGKLSKRKSNSIDYKAKNRTIKNISEYKQRMEFIPTIDFAEFGNSKPVNASASFQRILMRPKSAYMKIQRDVL